MTDLRMWSQLSPEERAEAVTKARAIIDGGEVRWHVVARLCGIKGGIGLRTAIDAGWRAQRKAEDRKRSLGRCRAGKKFKETARVSANRGTIAGMLNTPGHGPITLPRLKFMEE